MTTTIVDFNKVMETEETFRAYLEDGGDPHFEDRYGNTLLHWARSPEQVQLLIAAGVDVNHRNKQGKTPLFFASADTIPALIAAGADIHATDASGCGVLESCIYSNYDLVFDVEKLSGFIRDIEALLKHGASPFPRGGNQTPLLQVLVHAIGLPDPEDGNDLDELSTLRTDLVRIMVLAEVAWRAAHPETGP
jgi:ankyrin repeat protein